MAEIYIDNKIYARPKGDLYSKGVRAQLGFITGFPDDSHSTIKLHSDLINNGEAVRTYKGKKVTIRLEDRLTNPKGRKKMAAKKKTKAQLAAEAKKKKLAAAKKKAAAAKKKKAATKKKVVKKKVSAKKKVVKKKVTAKKKSPEKKTKVYKKNVPAKRGSIIVGLSDLRADKTYKDFMYYTAVGAIKDAWDKSIQEAAMWTTHAKAQKAAKKLVGNYPQNTAFFVVTQNASKANIEKIITRYGYERRGARKK